MYVKTFLNELYSLKYPASYKTDDTADTPVNINHMTICIVFFYETQNVEIIKC